MKTCLQNAAIILTPFILLPLVIFGGSEMRCMYGIIIMAIYWMSEGVPLGATSLLPLFLFPVLDILDGKVVAQKFTNDTTMTLLVMLIVAIAVENTNLHRRIALKMLSKVGSSKATLLAGFMCSTCFISFFLSDTATTALMLPIASAILESMMHIDHDLKADSFADKINLHKLTKEQRGFSKALILTCAQASLIGGTAIITSTAPNLIFRDEIQKRFPNGEVKISYMSWMAFALPPMILYLFGSYFILMILYVGPSSLLNVFRRASDEEKEALDEAHRAIKTSYKALGPITWAENSVMCFFGLLIVLWIFREPGFISGWSSLLPQSHRITDATVGILIVFILFIWPFKRPHFGKITPDEKTESYDMEEMSQHETRSQAKKCQKTILTWETVHHRTSWGVLLLIGAGFAISEAVKASGLSKLVSCAVLRFEHLPPIILQMIVTTTVTFMTEFMSNAATASIFVPVVQTISASLRFHPFYLGIPSAIAPSFSFMLPMSTAPNAIVYGTRVVSFFEMASSGFLLNIVCILITTLTTSTWAYYLFDMQYVPDIVMNTNVTNSC